MTKEEKKSPTRAVGGAGAGGRATAGVVHPYYTTKPDTEQEPLVLYDHEAEMALVGAALLGGREVLNDPVVQRVKATDFADTRLAAIWEALDGADGPPALHAIAHKTGLPIFFLLEVQEACLTPRHAATYAAIVREWSHKRKAQAIASYLAAAPYRRDVDFVTALREAESAVHELCAEAVPVRPPLSAAELLADTTQAPPDIVEGFIPGGVVVLLSGPGGDGKSYAMLDMAVCVARGTPWLGLNVMRCPVLICDLENHPVRVRERLRATLRGHSLDDEPPGNLYLHFEVNARLDSDAGIVELVRLVKDTGARLLILDSLVDYLGDVDENSNPEMARVAERMRAITEETGATVLAIHHTPKANAATPRGATALRNGIDVSIIAARDGNTFTLKQDKNRVGAECTITARLNWGDRLFNLLPLSITVGRAERVPDADEEVILEILADGEWHLSSDVIRSAMTKTKRTRRTIERKLRAMIEDAVLEALDPGKKGKPYHVRLPKNDRERQSTT